MRPPTAVLVPLVAVVLALATVGAPGASAAVVEVPPTSPPWVPVTDIRNNFYRQVRCGSTQVAGAGFNYRLLLRVADGEGSIGRYDAVVWGVPKSRDWTWKVVSFKRVAGN